MTAVLERPATFSRVSSVEAPPYTFGHISALDGLRGIAILVVMFHHGELFWMGRGGFLGVDIFFVLSGFLITSLLLQEWDRTEYIRFSRFYSRRALRLLPALFSLMIVALIGIWIWPPPEGRDVALKSLLIVLFYISNWIPALYPLGQTWSLSIEEQFYIVWPLTLFLMLKFRWKRLSMILLLTGVVLLVAAHRFEMFYSNYSMLGDAHHFRIYAGTDTRGDALLIGCLVGMILSWRILPNSRWFNQLTPILAIASAVFLAVMIFAAPIWWRYLYYGLLTVASVGVGFILIWICYFPSTRLKRYLEIRPLVWIGRLSYSLYIWHPLAYYVTRSLLPPVQTTSYTLNIMIPFAVKILVSFAIAILSYYLIETPFLRLKDRIRVVQA